MVWDRVEATDTRAYGAGVRSPAYTKTEDDNTVTKCTCDLTELTCDVTYGASSPPVYITTPTGDS